jgi:hypothetical protein
VANKLSPMSLTLLGTVCSYSSLHTSCFSYYLFSNKIRLMKYRG